MSKIHLLISIIDDILIHGILFGEIERILMFSEICCAAIDGIDALVVHVEVDVSEGLPMFVMVGYLGSEVREAKDRVRTAIRNSDYKLPVRHITINLAPANIRKSGTAFDLPIALAILAAMGVIPTDRLEGIMAVGELSLDGHIVGVNGILPVICEAKKKNFRLCIVPLDNLSEAVLIGGIDVIGAECLRDVVNYLNGADHNCEICSSEDIENDIFNDCPIVPNFCEIHGQHAAKRAATVAAAGKHNLLMMGPPGAGKTMLAQRIPSIMPVMSYEERLEVAKIYSIAGKLDYRNILSSKRPFRAPHHTATGTSMAGGGKNPKPGEISLASKGVLFLDELPEFSRSAIEILRQPLEDGTVSISRLSASYTFPAEFMLVTALNPCLCGYYPDRTRCRCNEFDIRRYMGKLSRPLLDRIDIHIYMQEIDYDDLHSGENNMSSAEMRSCVEKAVRIQHKRFEGKKISFNSQMSSEDIRIYCELGKKENSIMKNAYKKLGLTARGCHRILKVARTVADLDESERILERHLLEAVSYRQNINLISSESEAVYG